MHAFHLWVDTVCPNTWSNRPMDRMGVWSDSVAVKRHLDENFKFAHKNVCSQKRQLNSQPPRQQSHP